MKRSYSFTGKCPINAWLLVTMLLWTGLSWAQDKKPDPPAEKKGEKKTDKKEAPAAAESEFAPVDLTAGKDVLIFFELTGSDKVSEYLVVLNTEIGMTLESADKYKVIPHEDLGEHLLMDPVESLNFCNAEPGCIADLGESVNASWLLYGEISLFAEQNQLQVQLVLIDIPARKVAAEKVDMFNINGPFVQQTGNMLRKMIGLKVKDAPKPKAVVAEVPADEGPPADKPPKTIAKTSADSTSQMVTGTALAKPAATIWSNPWFWTAASVGVAGLGAGTALGIMTLDKQDVAEKTFAQPTAANLVHEAQDLALGANVALGIGAAAAATAVVLLILDLSADKPAVTDATWTVPGLSCTRTACGLQTGIKW